MPLRFFALALLAALCLAQTAPAQQPGQPFPVLDRKKPQAQAQFPLQLTLREREANPALAASEDALKALTARFNAQLTRLAAIRAESDRVLAERAAAEAQILAMAARLKLMLPELWAVSIGVKAGMDNAATPWEESDRRLTWLSAAYAHGREELTALQERSAELGANLARQEGLRLEMENQQAVTEKIKESLAVERIKLLRELEQLRQDTAGEAVRLDRVVEILAPFDFQPPLGGNRPISQAKGDLPWPVQGRLAASFAPDASPPRFGFGFACAKDASVHAVYWGKVVYCEPMRGLGRVVVVSHGQHAFTVYTHMSKTYVRPGQPVERGEALGQAGQYPPVQGPGLSFELRFREKPINPGGWLTASG